MRRYFNRTAHIEEISVKILPVLVWATAVLVWLSVAINSTAHSCATEKLTYAQRQMIAIEFMCGPGQHWKGMSTFCGSQILDDAVVKDSDGSISADEEKDSKWWH